ncbi:MAG: hypothetical protein J0H73_00705 [Salana multivorans]|nr:hypothetical protein [Salana multivorans]
MLALIVACEVGFWVAILSGLAVRYLLRRPRLGAGLLIAAPVIDVVLLVLVAIDLLRGGTASWEHGLAAIYIGFSVAFAFAIAGGLILLVGDPARTGALAATFRILGLILTIDLLWAISYTIWPRREVTASRGASVG